MTGLAIGSIEARDEISEVVVIAFRTRLLDTFVLVFFLKQLLQSAPSARLSRYLLINGCVEVQTWCL